VQDEERLITSNSSSKLPVEKGMLVRAALKNTSREALGKPVVRPE
jgi:hypothetical protein